MGFAYMYLDMQVLLSGRSGGTCLHVLTQALWR